MTDQPDPELARRRQPVRAQVRQSLVERRIREAMDDGQFDGLPHQGRRLPLEDDSAAGDRAVAFRLLKDARIAPDWIEADKEVRQLTDAVETLLARAHRVGPLVQPRIRRDLDDRLDALERAVFRLNAQAPTHRQHRARPDREALRARLEDAFRR